MDTQAMHLPPHILERHEKSAMHREAVERETYRLSSQRDGGIKQAFSKTVMVQRKALVGALKMLYWLAKEEIAHTTKFTSLMQLSINLGVDYLRALHLGGNAQYTSEQIIAELLHCLSVVIDEDILTSLRQSAYYSLMTDESTDIAVLKQLVLVARYVDAEGVKTSFLNICDIFDGTAKTIEAAILNYVDSKSLAISKLRGFGSDGAAVMTGRRTGVATRLKAHAPRMIAIHCVNHRLALAASHAADNIPYLQRFKTNLQYLFTFYQNSPVRLAGLHAIQEVLNDPIIKCKEAKDVRWLSHLNSIKAVIRTLPSLYVSLDREASERSEPTAHGLLKFIKSYEFIACAYLLADVLPHINRLSLIFQRQNIDLTLIQPCLQATIASINQHKDTPGPYLATVDQVITSELKGFDIRLTDAMKQDFKANVQHKYIQAIVDGLQARFPDTAELEAFSLFDPQKLPSKEEELVAYGQRRMELLTTTYATGDNADVDGEACVSEWESLRRLMFLKYPDLCMCEMVKCLVTDATLKGMFPQLTKLASITAILPVSTAECERAFSTMKRVKTVLRNRMKTETLDYLMRISIEGRKMEDFNFEKAADLWGKMRNRRLSIGSSSSSSD